MTFLKIIFFLAATSSLSGQIPVFEKNDRVVFIGDSITHGGTYHINVYLFHATRFPQVPFKSYNCGISGDTSTGTNIRFENDIAVHEPNAATIMLGMNDAWSWCFDPSKPKASRDEGLKNSLETYQKAMDELAGRLRKKGCKLTFITPSIFDETVRNNTPNNIGRNKHLGLFSQELRKLAHKHEASLIDFHAPMTALNFHLQKQDPTTTIIGNDRVHPGASGHFAMSYYFLKAQGMPEIVSAIELDAKKGAVVKSANCKIETGCRITPNRVVFTCTENALPYPVAKEQTPALDWVPFQEELNQQTLLVKGLEPGGYILAIDSNEIGAFSSKQLAEGINLADNDATPQYQQALRVQTSNNKRMEAMKKLRTLAHVRHTMLRKMKPKISEGDIANLEKALFAHVEKSKKETWYGYQRQQVEAFVELLPHEATIRVAEETHLEEIWQINKPKTHRWSLVKVSN